MRHVNDGDFFSRRWSDEFFVCVTRASTYILSGFVKNSEKDIHLRSSTQFHDDGPRILHSRALHVTRVIREFIVSSCVCVCVVLREMYTVYQNK